MLQKIFYNHNCSHYCAQRPFLKTRSSWKRHQYLNGVSLYKIDVYIDLLINVCSVWHQTQNIIYIKKHKPTYDDEQVHKQTISVTFKQHLY
jgi:hypothetical protein